MTYRQRAIALAKEAHRAMMTTGKAKGLFLVDAPNEPSRWTWAGEVDGSANILQRQWVVELKDNGSLLTAYNAVDLARLIP